MVDKMALAQDETGFESVSLYQTEGENMLEVKGLEHQVNRSKNPEKAFRLRDISFSLEQGYIMGLFGENGAGKSSLLRILYGMEVPDMGYIHWKGQNVVADSGVIRQEIAYVGEEYAFISEASIRENIELLQNLYTGFEQESWEKYLAFFELEGLEHKKEEELSLGQKKKIAIAFALARHPRLLLLDEPTASLDPVFRVELMALLQQLVAEEEMSILISTHIPGDVQDIMDYLLVLQTGKMVFCGKREEWRQERRQR